jgi:pimeloyl-ACP methyl ester carboxylesterase
MEFFSNLFGILMMVSFLFLMGIFNYTEANPARAWNGFPYRLFVLPVPTSQLVALPMISCVCAVELVYLAWIKLVWTRQQIEKPEWIAVVFAAYAIFYLSTLWTLAPFRIGRLIALGLGGASSLAVACLPYLPFLNSSVWLSEQRLSLMVAGGAIGAYFTAWTAVARQRRGGYLRRLGVQELFFKIIDGTPGRTKDFRSPSGAQFWFEWRQSGWLLPVCSFVVLLFIVAPVTWFARNEPVLDLIRIVAVPVILGFAIGKGFIKPVFWSANLAFPTFLGVRPVSAYEFMAAKLKVAAVGVIISWLLVFAFLALWLKFWAKTMEINRYLYIFRQVYPHLWLLITVLLALCLMAFTWKLMVAGLWHGLSGRQLLYYGSFVLQLAFLVLALLIARIWDETINVAISADRLITIGSAVLAVVVVGKFVMAAVVWRASDCPRRNFIVWGALTASLVLLAILSTSFVMNTYRAEHLLILLALLAMPLVRPGLTPSMLVRSRNGRFNWIRQNNKAIFVSLFLLCGIAIVLGLDLGRFNFKFVDVGGHDLRMLVMGRGSPAVVFETGARGSGGAPLEDWEKIQPDLSHLTATVSYDRAGVGLSAPGPAPRDARQIAQELHLALQRGGVPPPYVLVGHSFGGPFIRVFAGMYPGETSGMVLLDPTQEEFIEWEDKRKGHADIKESDWALIQTGLREAHASVIPTNIPVVLITGMGPRVLPAFVSEKDKAELQLIRPVWLKYHSQWLAKIPHSRHIITEKSGHGIMLTEPDLVVKVIHEMIEQIRNSAQPSPIRNSPNPGNQLK